MTAICIRSTCVHAHTFTCTPAYPLMRAHTLTYPFCPLPVSQFDQRHADECIHSVVFVCVHVSDTSDVPPQDRSLLLRSVCVWKECVCQSKRSLALKQRAN